MAIFDNDEWLDKKVGEFRDYIKNNKEEINNYREDSSNNMFEHKYNFDAIISISVGNSRSVYESLGLCDSSATLGAHIAKALGIDGNGRGCPEDFFDKTVTDENIVKDVLKKYIKKCSSKEDEKKEDWSRFSIFLSEKIFEKNSSYIELKLKDFKNKLYSTARSSSVSGNKPYIIIDNSKLQFENSNGFQAEIFRKLLEVVYEPGGWDFGIFNDIKNKEKSIDNIKKNIGLRIIDEINDKDFERAQNEYFPNIRHSYWGKVSLINKLPTDITNISKDINNISINGDNWYFKEKELSIEERELLDRANKYAIYVRYFNNKDFTKKMSNLFDLIKKLIEKDPNKLNQFNDIMDWTVGIKVQDDSTNLQNKGSSTSTHVIKDTISAKNTILYGPPGTGKTRLASIEAVRIVSGKDYSDEEALGILDKNNDNYDEDIASRIKLVQFFPGYSYNDFVETIDVTASTTEDGKDNYKDGIFKSLAKKAAEDKDNKYNKYVLIIDEINRANVSDVFGELLYGLEYREKNISTSISNTEFMIPDNLYIIGTMNTADKSLQTMDYAIRRRFVFEQVPSKCPDPTDDIQQNEDFYKIAGEKYFYKKIFDKVRKDVEKSVARGVEPEDVLPGISYFIVNDNGEGPDIEHLKYKINCELIPLLKEYVKDGLFTKREKVEDNKTLIELLGKDEYVNGLMKMIKDGE